MRCGLMSDRQKQKEESLAAKCRERGRRRIQIRIAMSPPATNNSYSSLIKLPAAAANSPDTDAEAAVPNCGSMSLAGRMREMEDAITIKMNLCRFPDNRPVHFFAVYDGHGGPDNGNKCCEGGTYKVSNFSHMIGNDIYSA